MAILMGLFDKLKTPKWKHKDVHKRMSAVKFDLDDQHILADVAKNDDFGQIREEAIKKIKDEAILEDIAHNASHSEIRERAVRKIKNEGVLIDIAKNDSDLWCRI